MSLRLTCHEMLGTARHRVGGTRPWLGSSPRGNTRPPALETCSSTFGVVKEKAPCSCIVTAFSNFSRSLPTSREETYGESSQHTLDKLANCPAPGGLESVSPAALEIPHHLICSMLRCL